MPLYYSYVKHYIFEVDSMSNYLDSYQEVMNAPGI